MADLDITYNDGLRLSELYGEMGDLQYKLNHIDLYLSKMEIGVSICIIILAISLALALYWFIDARVLSYYPNKKEKAMAALILAGYFLIIVGIWLFVIDYIETYVPYSLECDLARVKGEIAGILAKQGGGVS